MSIRAFAVLPLLLCLVGCSDKAAIHDEVEATSRLTAWQQAIAAGESPDMDTELVGWLYAHREGFPTVDADLTPQQQLEAIVPHQLEVTAVFANQAMRNLGHFTADHARLAAVLAHLVTRIIIVAEAHIAGVDPADPTYKNKSAGVDRMYDGLNQMYGGFFMLAFVEDHAEAAIAVVIETFDENLPRLRDSIPAARRDALKRSITASLGDRVRPERKAEFQRVLGLL